MLTGKGRRTMSDSGKVENADLETAIAEFSRASGMIMALYPILEDMVNKMMGDMLDGLNRIADYHREW